MIERVERCPPERTRTDRQYAKCLHILIYDYIRRRHSLSRSSRKNCTRHLPPPDKTSRQSQSEQERSNEAASSVLVAEQRHRIAARGELAVDSLGGDAYNTLP
eukprot:scaffold3436_cov156-Skeletonema_menzelii.AAC.4